LKRQVNISMINQCTLSNVIMVLFMYCSGYIIIVLSFLAKIFLFYILFYILNTTSGIRELSLENNCGLIFFRVDTYSNVLKPHIFVVTHINPRSGCYTCRKYKWFFNTHLLATLVTPVGTRSSGSASKNTCYRST
jgi:hypothetical protein